MKMMIVGGALAAALLAAPAQAQTPKTFVGSFKGITPGIEQLMTITEGDNGYQVRIQLKQGTCSGVVEASGKPKDHHILTVRNGACRLNMFRAGPNVQVEEEDCEGTHGPECSFTNIYSPR